MRNRPLQCDCRPLSSHEGGRGAIPERKRVLCKGETQRKRLAIPRFLGHVDASTPSAMSSIYARWFSIAWYFRVLSVEAVSGFMRRERYQRALSRSGWHGIFCIQGRLSKGDGRRRHESHTSTALQTKGKTVAEPQETRQEKETRWATQRATRDQEQLASRAARRRHTGRTWVIVGVIVIIGAVITTVVLL
jgi:hypothetical protein